MSLENDTTSEMFKLMTSLATLKGDKAYLDGLFLGMQLNCSEQNAEQIKHGCYQGPFETLLRIMKGNMNQPKHALQT